MSSLVELLLLARDSDSAVTRLAAPLEAAGCRLRRAKQLAEAEHLLHADGCEGLVVEAGHVEADFIARVHRERPTQALIGWLPRPSSSGAADLLEAGADEVLHPGMGDREIVARVLGALRRAHRSGATQLECGALHIDVEHGEVRWNGAELRLTRRERQVLQALAESAGRTVRRERLYKQVWGYAMARGDRSVDVNVKRLRDKLAKATGSALEIKTKPGVGYRLEIAAETVDAAVTSL